MTWWKAATCVLWQRRRRRIESLAAVAVTLNWSDERVDPLTSHAKSPARRHSALPRTNDGRRESFLSHNRPLFFCFVEKSNHGDRKKREKRQQILNTKSLYDLYNYIKTHIHHTIIAWYERETTGKYEPLHPNKWSNSNIFDPIFLITQPWSFLFKELAVCKQLTDRWKTILKLRSKSFRNKRIPDKSY